MYNLFLDDIRHPYDITLYKQNKMDWVIVSSYEEFVDHIDKNGLPKFVSLDHDLTMEHYLNGVSEKSKFKTKTGYNALIWLCKYIEKNKLKIPEIKFHTANYIGMKMMDKYLYEFKTKYESN